MGKYPDEQEDFIWQDFMLSGKLQNGKNTSSMPFLIGLPDFFIKKHPPLFIYRHLTGQTYHEASTLT